MTRICLFILLFMVCVNLIIPSKIITAAHQATPIAAEGVLDLSKWSLEQNGTIRLNGDWYFYWGQLLEPHEVTSPPSYAEVPSSWNKLQSKLPFISNEGYATYYLHVKLHPDEASKVRALYIPKIASAYTLWIDGLEVAREGEVATSFEAFVPMHRSDVVYFTPNSPEFDLVIQVANFDNRKGGIWDSLTFGTVDAINKSRELNMMLQMLVVGMLIIMGIYYLSIYLFQRQSKSMLFFGLFCVAITIRTLIVGDVLILSSASNVDWTLLKRIEYLSENVAYLTIVFFLKNLYPHEVHRYFVYSASMITSVYSSVVLFASVGTFTSYMPLMMVIIALSGFYLLYVYFMAAKRKREGAALGLVFGLVFFLTIMNDYLFHNNIIHSIDLMAYGFIVFLIAQIIIITINYSNLFKKVDKLTLEVHELNQGLERKLHERTKELVATNRHLVKLENTRKQLLANVAYDLGTPLSAIHRYLSMVKDGKIQGNDPAVFPIMMKQISDLHDLTQDLYELSKLEMNKATFHKEQIGVLNFLEKVYEKHQANSNIHLADIQYEAFSNVYIYIDIDTTFRAFDRLIQSGLEDSFGERKIILSLGCNAEREAVFTIEVHDFCITEEEIAELFVRYYESRKVNSASTGLELVLAKEIIEKQGGAITAEKNGDDIFAFRLTFPVVQTKSLV